MGSGTTLRAAFAHTKAGHCGSGSLRDLLAFEGLDFGAGPLSEGMVFGLGGGLGFLYTPVADQPQRFYLVGRTATMERDFAAHLGIPLEVLETEDPATGWGWVRDAIDDRRPLMVLADIQRLEYLRVRMQNTQHAIVVVDYSADEGVAWIADNDRDELEPCSLESLASARHSPGFPGPNRHRTFDYTWPAALPDPAGAVRAAVATAVRNMQGGGDPLGGLKDAGTGLAGVAQFAAAYPSWPDAFGDDLPAALAGLRVFVVKAGTGGAMFRSLHAEFLHDAAAVLDDRALGRLGEVYDQLAAAWVALAEAAAAGDHAGGAGAVAVIRQLEPAGVAGMQAWLAS
ncbi:BtrH N-terminal domain-containing protein [Paraconexibacter sp. AEG42_29]